MAVNEESISEDSLTHSSPKGHPVTSSSSINRSSNESNFSTKEQKNILAGKEAKIV